MKTQTLLFGRVWPIIRQATLWKESRCDIITTVSINGGFLHPLKGPFVEASSFSCCPFCLFGPQAVGSGTPLSGFCFSYKGTCCANMVAAVQQSMRRASRSWKSVCLVKAFKYFKIGTHNRREISEAWPNISASFKAPAFGWIDFSSH